MLIRYFCRLIEFLVLYYTSKLHIWVIWILCVSCKFGYWILSFEFFLYGLIMNLGQILLDLEVIFGSIIMNWSIYLKTDWIELQKYTFRLCGFRADCPLLRMLLFYRPLAMLMIYDYSSSSEFHEYSHHYNLIIKIK